MIRVFAFISFFILCLSLSAQNVTTFTVRGLLTDSIERQPLDAANVIVSRATDSVYVSGVMSDQKGLFELEKLQARLVSYGFTFTIINTKVRKNIFIIATKHVIIYI